MTDVDHVDDDDQGDAPDRIDDRLADIARLIDALAGETDLGRRALHRAIAERLITRTGADVLDRIAALFHRLDEP
jgi:hypothetical protein